MNSIEDLKFGEQNLAHARNAFTFSAWSAWCRKILGYLFQPSGDLQYLNAHLLRDAGIDEIELEREAARTAPLIRWCGP